MPETPRDITGIRWSSRTPSIAPKGKNHFLGIAIDTYQNFLPLKNAVKDVKDISQLLTDKYGFEKTEITLLINEAATRKNIIKQLKILCTKVGVNDRVLIYYSGHGYLDEITDRGYWIPINANKDDESSYVANANLRDYIKAMKSKHTLLISDSCFSGSLLARDASRKLSGAFDTWEAKQSRFVFSSGKGIVSDGKAGENSPFAKAIIEQLTHPEESRINIVHLADEVTKTVRFNYEQQPEINPLFGAGHNGGQFVFHLQEAIIVKKEEVTTSPKVPTTLTVQSTKPNPIINPSVFQNKPQPTYINTTETDSQWITLFKSIPWYIYAMFTISVIAGVINEFRPKPIEAPVKFYDADSNSYGFKRQNDLVIPPSYQYAEEFVDGKAKVASGGNTFFIDINGRCIQDCPPKIEKDTVQAAPIKVDKESKTQAKSSPITQPKKPSQPPVKKEEVKKTTTKPNKTRPSTETGTLAHGGQTYTWARFKDGKKWMTQNLNFQIDESWCYKEKEINCQKYGRLYSWAAAQKACPIGWRLPSDEDWWNLASKYGKAYNNLEGQPINKSNKPGEAVYQALMLGGSAHFSAQLGGSRLSSGNYASLNKYGNYWSSTERSGNHVWDYLFNKTDQYLGRGSTNKKEGKSCRCVKD